MLHNRSGYSMVVDGFGHFEDKANAVVSYHQYLL